MENNLNTIFQFLKKNRKFNKKCQTRYYLSISGQSLKTQDRALRLLYAIVNTQSQPRIDCIASFFENLYSSRTPLKSFKSFLNWMDPDQDFGNLQWQSLFMSLKKQSGWGDKTSALFTKSLYHMHNRKYPNSLAFWQDVPSRIARSDRFYLPVDKVILHVFNQIDSSSKWTFSSVNAVLQERYSGPEMEIWDDLWYWGFFTQKGGGEKRICEWNPQKYWAFEHAVKKDIDEVESKAEEFLDLLG